MDGFTLLLHSIIVYREIVPATKYKLISGTKWLQLILGTKQL